MDSQLQEFRARALIVWLDKKTDFEILQQLRMACVGGLEELLVGRDS